MKREALIQFWTHLTACLSSGITLIEAIKIFPLKGASASLKTFIKTIELQLVSGVKLSEILSQFALDDFSITIVKMSEVKGDYIPAAQVISQHLEWQLTTKRNITKALQYPVTVLFILMIVVWILCVNVVPEIGKFLQLTNHKSTYYLNIEQITWVLRVLMRGFAYGGVCLGCAYFVVGFFSNAPRLLRDRLLFGLQLVSTSAYCSYLYVIGQSLQSGVTLQDSLNIAEKSIKNQFMLSKILAFKKLLKNGKTISDAAGILPLAPRTLKPALKQAEINGALAETLKQLALNLNNSRQESINTLANSLGPALTIFIGLIMLGIVLMVIFPIYDNLGAIDG